MLLIASTISTALSFQTDFSSRSKRGFVPVPWFFATRYLYIFSSPLTLFFFLYRKEITFRDEFIHESRDIEDIFFPFFFVPSRKRKNEEKPSLKNSENLEIKPYKKKNCIFFITFDDAQTRRRRLGERGRSELLEDSYYTPSGQYNETILVRRAA